MRVLVASALARVLGTTSPLFTFTDPLTRFRDPQAGIMLSKIYTISTRGARPALAEFSEHTTSSATSSTTMALQLLDPKFRTQSLEFRVMMQPLGSWQATSPPLRRKQFRTDGGGGAHIQCIFFWFWLNVKNRWFSAESREQFSGKFQQFVKCPLMRQIENSEISRISIWRIKILAILNKST